MLESDHTKEYDAKKFTIKSGIAKANDKAIKCFPKHVKTFNADVKKKNFFIFPSK